MNDKIIKEIIKWSWYRAGWIRMVSAITIRFITFGALSSIMYLSYNSYFLLIFRKSSLSTPTH